MINDKIWLSSPTMHGDEQRFVQEAFNTNWIAPLGPHVDAFEAEIAAYMGVEHGAALMSGTAAIHLAVKLAGVKSGDVVFCSDLTFAATVNPVSYEGGVQVFIDAERDTWNMDPRALERAFVKYPKCKCVIIANLYGTPAKLDEISDICMRNGAVLIEDAAESLSAVYKGRQTGSFGKYGVVSFNGNKIITTSGGGMLLSNDGDAIQKARFWSTQSREPALWYQHNEIGYNYRMSNVAAAIGRGQLLHLEEHRLRKTQIYNTYLEAFADVAAIEMNPYLACSIPNHWLSCIMLHPHKTHVQPNQIIDALAKENIEARPIWKPMHLQPVFAGHDFISVDDDVGGHIFNQGLCLPSDIKMTEEEQMLVCDVVCKCIGCSTSTNKKA